MSHLNAVLDLYNSSLSLVIVRDDSLHYQFQGGLWLELTIWPEMFCVCVHVRMCEHLHEGVNHNLWIIDLHVSH